MKRTLLILLAGLLLCPAVAQVRPIDYSGIAPHPRLFLQKDAEKAIRKVIRSDKGLARAHFAIIDYSDKLLTEHCLVRPESGHILAISREALKRIFYLSYAYRITGMVRYAERAEKEMLNVCGFRDWDPEHFLDTAEMLLALAIGYDWLYDRLSPRTRDTVRTAIIEKGFEPTYDDRYNKFYGMNSNWNQVCNSGVICAALAVYEDNASQGRDLIARSLKSNPLALTSYAPDGGYPEGYSYWYYGTGFQVFLIAALESALGTDAGLSEYPGFLKSARFIQFMTTPAENCFGFYDSGTRAVCNPLAYWFAKRCNDPSLAWLEPARLMQSDFKNEEFRYLPAMLVFASQYDGMKRFAPQQHFWFNHGNTPVFVYRSTWDSDGGAYLAVKGGCPQHSHAHMDAGSFYFEKEGVVWATDLGVQSYGSFYRHNIHIWDFSQQGERWSAFRLSNISHNTLTINNERHDVMGYTPITRIWKEPKRKGAEADLTPALRLQIDSAVRQVWLNETDTELTIRDSLATGEKPADVWWNMTTTANARIVSGNSILLTKKGKSAMLTVEASGKVEMQIRSTDPPCVFDAKNPGTCRVGFRTRIDSQNSAVLYVKIVCNDK